MFITIRDAGLNEAVWVFSLRYWVISFVIPWQLKSQDTPKSFLILSTTLFVLGLILNLIAPVGYSYYGYEINNTLTLTDEVQIEKYNSYRTQFYAFKIAIAALQVISGIFMIWAIKRLY